MKASIRRLVDFYEVNEPEPCPALITRVHTDTCVDVVVFPPGGESRAITCVDLVAQDQIEDYTKLKPNTLFCAWPDAPTGFSGVKREGAVADQALADAITKLSGELADLDRKLDDAMAGSVQRYRDVCDRLDALEMFVKPGRGAVPPPDLKHPDEPPVGLPVDRAAADDAAIKAAATALKAEPVPPADADIPRHTNSND